MFGNTCKSSREEGEVWAQSTDVPQAKRQGGVRKKANSANCPKTSAFMAPPLTAQNAVPDEEDSKVA